MTYRHLVQGLLVSSLALGVAACGDDEGDGGGGSGNNGADGGTGNGTTNGATNGMTNGATNGTTNGATNGTTNGATNGTTNGATNGTTNGATGDAGNGGEADGGSGGGDAGIPAECATYCEDILEFCTGDDEQFADEDECLAACGEYPIVVDEDAFDGDSLQCRLNHLELAEDMPDPHCGHAGETGEGGCD